MLEPSILRDGELIRRRRVDSNLQRCIFLQMPRVSKLSLCLVSLEACRPSLCTSHPALIPPLLEVLDHTRSDPSPDRSGSVDEVRPLDLVRLGQLRSNFEKIKLERT